MLSTVRRLSLEGSPAPIAGLVAPSKQREHANLGHAHDPEDLTLLFGAKSSGS
ncbi:hypothetical protein [Dactylosporangium fulvum]|uniref:Uncharacterized protein n=1 Tax=Dactylosporangium fulvum TaxID=53359 RepID=A0ABY5W2L9_9ACTN|nr:hypothetical protein [Dactylosporangium fulvum]UWP83640.1 hypothetical protein Dfulv_05040 [Dactylosporangium fulvum]